MIRDKKVTKLQITTTKKGQSQFLGRFFSARLIFRWALKFYAGPSCQFAPKLLITFDTFLRANGNDHSKNTNVND